MKSITKHILIIGSLLLTAHVPVIAQPVPDFQVNENASPDGSKQSDARIGGDGQGNYIVTWQDKRNGIDYNILAQIYQSDGTPAGANFRVSHENGHSSQYRPDVAADANLNFVITWLDKRRGDWEVYVQRFSNDGTALGDHFTANEDQEGTEQECPSITMDGAGNFVVVWADKRSGDWDVYARRYASDGTALGSAILVNDDDGNTTQYWPACAGNEAGDFVVTWADQRGGDYDVYLQHYLADGTALGNNVRVSDDVWEIDQMVSDAAVDVNGNFIVAWSDERNGHWDVYAQRYSGDGQVLGDNFRVNEENTNSFHTRPSLATDQTGGFVVTWTDGRNEYSDIFAQRYSENGTPIGDNILVNDNTDGCYQYSSEIIVNGDGSFTIAWDDHRLCNLGDIYLQSYAGDGTPVRDNVKVNDDQGSENQAEPSIARDSAGNFVIAWSDQRSDCGDIYAQRYSSDGAEQGVDFKVNDDEETYCQWEPCVASDADGNFVVVWTDWREDLWYVSDIYAQRYAHDGTPLGTNFVVSVLGAYIHCSPEVVYESTGGFIVVWGDSVAESLKRNRESGSHPPGESADEPLPGTRNTEPDIYFQRYSGDGTPLGSNIMVNDDGEHTSQTSPTIAVDANDNFTIAWEDARNGERDIYYQQYTADGTPLGINRRMGSGDPGDDQTYPSISMDDSGDFVITWKDDRDGHFDIYAQRFFNDGSEAGENFRVNGNSGSIYQSSPSVSVNRIGNFVIAWSERQDGDDDIFARRFLRGGLPFGEIYRVSNTDELEQFGPVVVLGDNRIFTAWKDNRGEQSGFDIWANVMDWDSSVAVGSRPPASPSATFGLNQNSPNPFNPQTTIEYELHERATVTLRIFDLAGRLVDVIVGGEIQSAGSHTATWGGCDSQGRAMPSGTYFYRLEAGAYTGTMRMSLIR